MKISVLIPTISPKKEYFQQTISSIPADIDEVVIIGSGFDLGEYKIPEFKEFKIFNLTIGLTEAINLAVDKYVTGDFFSILPDDDYYTPQIAKIVDQVKQSAADFVYFPSKHIVIDAEASGLYDNVPSITFEQNLENNQITGSAFIRKRSFQWLEGYNGEICMDWDLYNRALKSGMYFEYINIPGIYYRINNHSRLQKKAQEMGQAKIRKQIKESADAWSKRLHARCAAGMGLC